MNWSNKVFRKNLECLVGCGKIGVVGVIWILKNFKKERTEKEKFRKKIENNFFFLNVSLLWQSWQRGRLTFE